MLNRIKVMSIGLCALSVIACSSYNPNGYADYRSYVYDGEPIYPESYEHYNPNRLPDNERPVFIPESYHMNAYQQAPVTHQDGDKHWVQSQNPKGYTIQVGDADKPAQVANTLQQVPKTDRTAEIKYQKNGKDYYKGVYGSYPNADAAKEALDKLPENIKKQATVQPWKSVQGSNTTIPNTNTDLNPARIPPVSNGPTNQ